MSARDEILGRLRDRARPTPLPRPWRSRRAYTDLAATFEAALVAAKGEVHRVGTLEGAVVRLGELLAELDARAIVANHEPPLDALDLPSRHPDQEWAIAGAVGRDALRAACAAADVGVSGAVAALAESGSVAIESGPGRSRLVTLLPPVHIALVATSQLTADLFTWSRARARALPANRVLVSGPSKSADIEQTLAVGVHGPRRFIVILYDSGEGE